MEMFNTGTTSDVYSCCTGTNCVIMLMMQDCLRSCHEQIERLLANSSSKHSPASEPESFSHLPLTAIGSGASSGAPTTPTDAFDVLLAH